MPLPDGLRGTRPILTCGAGIAFVTGNQHTARARDKIASAVLSGHAGSAVMVERRASNRPRLVPPWPELGVSLSHRDDLLLVGFSPSRDVGVDLEVFDETLDVLQLARDHFAADEYIALADQPETSRHDFFYRLWCAKEAVLKATGRGISDGMQQPNFSQAVDTLLLDKAATPVDIAGRWRATVTVSPVTSQQGRRFMAALAVLD